jgi:hypothetical protein
METAARYCKHCGTAFGEDSARFCKKCGAARQEPVGSPPAADLPAAARTVAIDPAVTAARAASGRVAGVATRVAGGGSLAASLPWQTIGAGEPIDASVFLRGAAPTAARALSRSLRRPGLILAFTVAMSFAVALLTGGTDALVSALPQLLAGAAASVLALLARGDAGRLRSAAGVVSVVAAIVSLVSVGVGLARAIDGGEGLVAILPLTIAMASSALAAGKTALVALRRSR